MNIKDKLKVLNLRDIKPYKNNIKIHTDEQIEQIKKSIENNEYIQPVCVDKNNTIVIGHGRYFALQQINPDMELEVIDLSHLNEKQINKMRILDNKLNESEWNFDNLENELKKIYENIEDGIDKIVDDLNFDKDFLRSIIGKEKEDIEDDIPDIEKSVIKQGDLIELGRHRLLCGDSTKKEDVDRLMNGNKADMVFTDPPYNLAFIGGSRKIKFNKLINDNQTNKNWINFIIESLNRIKEITKGNVYICIDWRKYGKVFMEINKRWKIYNCIVWIKNQLSMGMRYRFRHEFIIYADTNGAKWKGNHSETDVWEVNKEIYKKYKHPTQKPVLLINRALINTSKVEDIIADLFLGSGSTLIACEKTGRICYGMEIDEHYCDVIIERYCNYTNNYNIKINGNNINWSETMQKIA